MEDFLDFLKVGLNVDIQRTDGKHERKAVAFNVSAVFGHRNIHLTHHWLQVILVTFIANGRMKYSIFVFFRTYSFCSCFWDKC